MELPSQLQELLPSSYSYKLKKFTSFENEPAHFECIILTNVYTEEEAQEWWHEFNVKSNTTMRVRATCPKTGKVNLFKIYLRCLHQGRAEKVEKNGHSEKTKSAATLKRNTNCPAGMIVAIRRVIKYSRSKMRDPADPVHPCEIHIRFIHNHPTASADSLRYRPVSKAAEEKLINLYQSGHSPASALETLKIDLQIEYGSLFSKFVSDRYYCPDKSFCYRLYYKHFVKDYAASVKKDSRSMLTSKVSHYNTMLGETCLAVGVTGVEHVIAVCTPLMKRAHMLTQSGDMVYVELYESPSNKDRSEHHILLLSAHTPVGGIPLGAILATNNSKIVLTLGFQLLKQLLPEQAFNGRGVSGPHVFLIENSENQKDVLNHVWPDSDVIICIFRILQSMWQWLWDDKHNVLKEHRLYLLYLLKTVLFASTDTELTNKYQALCADNICILYPLYLHQIESLWQRQHLWSICFHRLLPLQGANSYYEAAVRTLKDKSLEQTKAFNIIQILNYLVTRHDFYYRTKFINILQKKTNHIFLCHFPNTLPSHISDNIKQVAGNYYVVPSENCNDKFYTVDVELNICSCPSGMNGILCIHQYWIYLKMPSEMFKADISDTDFNKKLCVVASVSLSHKNNSSELSSASSEINNQENSSDNFQPSMETVITETASNSGNIQLSENILSHKPANSETPFKNCSVGSSDALINLPVLSPALMNSNENPVLAAIAPSSGSEFSNIIKSGDISQIPVSEDKEKNEINVSENNQRADTNSRKEKVLEKFEKFCQKIKEGLNSHPEDFIPALEIMMKTVERRVNTKEQIVSSLKFFGILSAQSLISQRKKRPSFAFGEEIVPKVHGHQMITYGKKKAVSNQEKSIDQANICPTSNNNENLLTSNS